MRDHLVKHLPLFFQNGDAYASEEFGSPPYLDKFWAKREEGEVGESQVVTGLCEAIKV